MTTGPDGTFIPLCRAGKHPMTEANTVRRAHGPDRTLSTSCRTCTRERDTERRRQRRREAAHNNTHKTRDQLRAQRPTKPAGATVKYRYELDIHDDGTATVRVEADLFEYVLDEDYLNRARRPIREALHREGIPTPRGAIALEEIDRDRDWANPEWTTSITYRTVTALFNRKEEAA